ncbi:SRPBCC domain-containing protein [Modestobacter versicolor]|uniref:Polyketide cyclase n=1 Tax=Modestobacter versicolor TaxID=429133 RepID=A0A323VCR2_9ACTN|nr:SRPBCC domain-containing protein [Modestobacter versicolor]MBB3677522.1 uncharacterized protein YndB with AHSA1/START domain [Modestobacter versicolor]PZA21853.1 polyketide cyclase [Modestobacter versicolor]
MEHGSIEREFTVQAAPEVVFDVLSSPEHIARWWGADAVLDPTPGAVGELAWNDRAHVTPLTVVEADPPRTFSFRWAYDDESPSPTNSFLVTFTLRPTEGGTVVRLVETGFRERGWADAVAQAHHDDHVQGWDQHLATLRGYVTRLATAR